MKRTQCEGSQNSQRLGKEDQSLDRGKITLLIKELAEEQRKTSRKQRMPAVSEEPKESIYTTSSSQYSTGACEGKLI